MDRNTQAKYASVLTNLKEKNKTVRKLKDARAEEIDIEEIRENSNELVLSLQEQGITSVSDLKTKAKEIGKNTDNTIKLAAPAQEGNVVITMLKNQFLYMGTSMLLTGLIKAIKTVGRWIIGVGSAIAKFITGPNAKYIGISAILFTFAWILYKVYKKIVDKAKTKQANPTREDLAVIFDTDTVLRESQKELIEAMSPDRQAQFIDNIINLCQDALDVIGALSATGMVIWALLTVTALPLLIACATGAVLWTILFLTRNALKRSQMMPVPKQTPQVKQTQKGMIYNA